MDTAVDSTVLGAVMSRPFPMVLVELWTSVPSVRTRWRSSCKETHGALEDTKQGCGGRISFACLHHHHKNGM